MEHIDFLLELRKVLTTSTNEHIPPTVISAVITGYMGSDKHYSIHTYNERVIRIMAEIKKEWEQNKVYKSKYNKLRNAILKLPFRKKRSVIRELREVL